MKTSDDLKLYIVNKSYSARLLLFKLFC